MKMTCFLAGAESNSTSKIHNKIYDKGFYILYVIIFSIYSVQYRN